MVVNQLLKYGEFGIVLFDNFQVTERTRNQFAITAREFESHRLRQEKPQSNSVEVFHFYLIHQEKIHLKAKQDITTYA